MLCLAPGGVNEKDSPDGTFVQLRHIGCLVRGIHENCSSIVQLRQVRISEDSNVFRAYDCSVDGCALKINDML